jgi:hypothetical protein
MNRIASRVSAAAATVLLCTGCFPNEPFDEEAWKSARPEGHSICMGLDRSPMIADLRDNYLLVGMTMKEVRALLGKPTYVWNEDEFQAGRVRWDYATDADALGLDCIVLDIVFVDGRLVRTAKAQT